MELGFLAFCRASLSQGLEIHHSLYNYPSFPSCRRSMVHRAKKHLQDGRKESPARVLEICSSLCLSAR